MQILGYSRNKDIDVAKVDSALRSIGKVESLDELLLAADVGSRPKSFSPDRFVGQYKADGSASFYREGEIVFLIDGLCHQLGDHVFSHTRIELNLYRIDDGANLLTLLKQLGDLFEFELGFVLETETPIVSYNAHPLGAGLGLVGLKWGMYLSWGFAELIQDIDSIKAFKKEKSPNGALALLLTSDFKSFMSMSESEEEEIRSSIGSSLFSPYQHNRPQRAPAKSQSTWILSPSNLMKVGSLFKKPDIRKQFEDQAKLVPQYYRL